MYQLYIQLNVECTVNFLLLFYGLDIKEKTPLQVERLNLHHSFMRGML